MELQSSGWEPEGEERASEGNVDPSEKTEISQEESKEDSTLLQEQSPLKETTRQSPTTPKPKPSTTPKTKSTTQRLKVTISTKKPTTLATTTETAAETTKAKWEKQRIRQGEKLSEEDIPEAEEAGEFLSWSLKENTQKGRKNPRPKFLFTPSLSKEHFLLKNLFPLV